MKTSTPKLLTEEKSLKVEQHKLLNLSSFLISLITLFIGITIVYLMLFSSNDINSDKFDQHVKYSASQAEFNENLLYIKNYVSDLKKILSENIEKEVNMQKMSKSYNVKLLASSIKAKIILGSDFQLEMEELGKITHMQKDINFQNLQKYLSHAPIQVNNLISNLYDEAANYNKHNDSTGFIEATKYFFTNLFTVKRVDDHKIYATTNEITSIIVQLLVDGRIEAAYTVANKFRIAHSSIAKIADVLKPANDALNAVSKLELYS